MMSTISWIMSLIKGAFGEIKKISYPGKEMVVYYTIIVVVIAGLLSIMIASIDIVMYTMFKLVFVGTF